MKISVFILSIIIMAFIMIPQSSAWDQNEVRISPFIGYTIGDGFRDYNYYDRNYYSRVDLDDGMTYGLRIGYGVGNGFAFELSMAHMISEFYSRNTPEDCYNTDVDLYIVQGNFLVDMIRGPFEPYLSIGMGTTIIDRDFGDNDANFTASLASGFVIKITNNLGFRAELKSNAIYLDDYDCCYDSYYYSESNRDYLYTFDATFGLSFII